ADRGAEFVETLKLFYPQADALCEKDFDWLFDCPHTKQFLEWFCSTVTEQNALSPAEVEAYEALLAAGKPILEGEALDKVLQTCCQGPTMIPDDEGPSVEALQQELQELKGYRDCLHRGYSKVRVCVARLQQELKYLEEEEKGVQQDLRKARRDLQGEICQTRAVLSQVSEDAKQLAEWVGDTGKGRPPALMCEMDLGPYMDLEDPATEVFEKHIQQILPGTIQAPDTQGASDMDDSQEATGTTGAKQRTRLKSLGTKEDELPEDQESYWKELCRIEKAHICAQWEVTVTSAKVEGHCAAVEWAQRTLEALEENQQVAKAELLCQAPSHPMRLHSLRGEIMQTLTHQLPPLLREQARCSTLPVLQRQSSLEAARLQDIARRQKEMASWLANQHSRLELLEFQLKRETKELAQKATWMKEMETAMKEFQTTLQKLQDYFKDASSSQKGPPCTRIEPEDTSAIRLWDVLVGQDQEEKPYRSYQVLEARCAQLVQERKELEAQLAAPMPHIPALESSTEALYQLLYDSSNQLQLTPPVSE
ncbi:HAUS3 protein, partial [Centropus bengalensis]|nr:HAUS3 protein [Centropus bengalensis]